jgi:hypothetical protein
MAIQFPRLVIAKNGNNISWIINHDGRLTESLSRSCRIDFDGWRDCSALPVAIGDEKARYDKQVYPRDPGKPRRGSRLGGDRLGGFRHPRKY